MAKFCKYCGTPLQDGEICTCPQARAEAAQQSQGQPPQGGFQQPPQGGFQQPPQQPTGPNPFVLALQKLLPYIQSYVRAPVSAAQELLGQNDMIFAGILLGIQVIVAALGLLSLLGSVCGVLGEFIAGMMGLGSLGAVASFSIGPSIPMTLIFGILAGAAAVAVHVAIVFAVTKLLGVNRTFPEALVICGAHSPLVTALLLVAFILNLLYLPLALVCFLAAMLTWIVLSVLSLQTLAPAADQSKFWISAIAGALAALLIGGWVSWFLGSKSVGYITISAAGQSITINEALEASGSSLEDIFENMLDNLF